MNREPDALNDVHLSRLLDAVRRRLLVRRFGSLACRNLLAALAMVLPAAVFSAFRPSPHLAGAAAALCGLGIVIAIAQAAVRRPERIDAALHIDRHFKLQERLSSFVSMPASDAPAADAPSAVQVALAQDTFAHARGIRPPAACPLSIPRSAPFTGAALFCVAALLFGTATPGNADRQAPGRSELDPMMTSGAPSYVRVDLTPEQQAELNRITGASTDNLDATLGRLEDLLSRFTALQGITESMDRPFTGDFDAADIKAMLAETPDARTRLEAALEQAAKELGADEKLAEAVRKAQEALAQGLEEEFADSLEKLIGKLAAETAQYQFDKLKDLKARLADARDAASDAKDGVPRVLETGRTMSNKDVSETVLPQFPENAAIKARGAVEAGRVPARYRWFVERYFRDDESPADRTRSPASGP
jgi:hypothetical protein